MIGSSRQRSKVTNSTVHFKNLALCPSKSARNLGVIFDSGLDFKEHISSICRTSFFHIRQLRQLRSSLDKDSAVVLANALVHSKLDYCNSLFYGLPKSSIIRLQYVQNSLARVVCRASRQRSHTRCLLRNLHWLPVSERIRFKIAVITFKALHLDKPIYLRDLISYYRPSRHLRSSSGNLLAVPNITSAAGRRSFSYSAPTVWNSLPPELLACDNLSTFCSKLKSFLFPP